MPNIFSKMKTIMEDFYDLVALQKLSPLINEYKIWSGSAMRPSAIVTILNDIIINDRQTIIECGSGLSTIIISKQLKKLSKGHIYSIEHNQEWANIIQEMLALEGLEDFVTLIYAPLSQSENSDEHAWYDWRAIEEHIKNKKVDLLLVDGPPAYAQGYEYARKPALSHFKKYLSSKYSIVLDDINRVAESEILHAWSTELDEPYKKYGVKYGSIGIISSDQNFHIN